MVFAVGQTITSGIQDISALLPLLGTEQGEEHIGSSLNGGYLYAAAAPLSIFGSLGIVSAGFKALGASIVFNFRGKKVMGAKILASAGFEPIGKVLSLIMWRDKCLVGETELTATLEELHITDVKKLSVADATFWIWNLSMLFASVWTTVLSVTPYIYFIIKNQDDPLSWRWLLPAARSVGSAIVSNLTQFVIQIRLLEITNARILFLTLDGIIRDEDIALPRKWKQSEWWGADQSSEMALHHLRTRLGFYFNNPKPHGAMVSFVHRALAMMGIKRYTPKTEDCEGNLRNDSQTLTFHCDMCEHPTLGSRSLERAVLDPTTLDPTTLDLTTLDLTTLDRTTLDPTAPNPTTPSPTTPNPTTSNPTTPNPTTPNSTTLNPSTPNPTTPNPSTSNPTTLNPTTPNPSTSNPTTLNPTTPNSTTLNPSTPNPSTLSPTTLSPTTPNPTTPNPSTSNPSTLNSTTLNPAALGPSTLNPPTLDLKPLHPTMLNFILDNLRRPALQQGRVCRCFPTLQLDLELPDLEKLVEQPDLETLTRELKELRRSALKKADIKEGFRVALEKLYVRNANLGIIANARKLKKLKDVLEETEKTSRRSSLLLVSIQIAILCGMVLTLIGYVGCFSLVQSSITAFGPLLWLIVEVILSLTRLAIWASNPTWDEARTFFTLHLKLPRYAPLPTCDKFSEELDEEREVPLARSRDFLGDVTSFVGLLEPFKINEDGVAVYYTMTRRMSGEQTLYVTVSDYKENISRTLVYPSRTNAVSGMDCHVAKLHAEDGEGDDGTVWATIMGKTSMGDNHITEDHQTVTELKAHCSSIVQKIIQHVTDANQHYTKRVRPPLEIKMTWTLRMVPQTQTTPLTKPIDADPTKDDDMAYLRFGELERHRRALCWERGRWVDEYVSLVTDEALNELTRISNSGHPPAALQMLAACTEHFISYVLKMMEMMLVDETSQLEGELRRRGLNLINDFGKKRHTDEEWTALRRKMLVEWKKNAVRRVKREAEVMEQRIAKFRKEAQGRLGRHSGPMPNASKHNWEEAVRLIKERWEHLIKDTRAFDYDSDEARHQAGDQAGDQARHQASTKNRVNFDYWTLDKLIVQNEYQDPYVSNDVVALMRHPEPDQHPVKVGTAMSVWLMGRISWIMERLGIEEARISARLNAMALPDKFPEECRKFDGSPFAFRLVHKRRFVKLPSQLRMGAGVDVASAIADALKWNPSISWVGCTECSPDVVVALIRSTPWTTNSVTMVISPKFLGEVEGKILPELKQALRQNKSILSVAILEPYSTVRPFPDNLPGIWKDDIESNRTNAFDTINNKKEPRKLVYYELATISDVYASSSNPHLRFYWPGRSSACAIFSIPGGANAGKLFVRLVHGCENQAKIDIKLNAHSIDWAQNQCPQGTLAVQDILLPCDQLNRDNRNELKINLLEDEGSFNAEYWLRDVQLIWRDVDTGGERVW